MYSKLVGEEDGYDFFIVHASGDKAWAERIYEALEANGRSTFLDSKIIRLGDRSRPSITTALDGSRVIIVLVGRKAEDAPYYETEIDRAIELRRKDGRRIVPVLIDGATLENRPLGLPFQAVVLDDGKFDVVIEQLLRVAPPRPLSPAGDFIDTHVAPAFSGRPALVGALQAWLGRPDAATFGLLTAPAGRGKSTVLSHFARREDLGPYAVVFHAISLRFRTSRQEDLLRALVRDLRRLHREKALDLSGLGDEQLAADVRHHLDLPLPGGRRLLLIIDGLDEARGFRRLDAIPAVLRHGTRVLVSARENVEHKDAGSWRDVLGWNDAVTFRLEPLSPAEVRALCEQRGIRLPDPFAMNRLATELHRLTAGEPLDLGLLLEELAARPGPITVDSLAGLEPGRNAAFARWLGELDEEVREQAHEVLGVFARAHGPLSLDDLAALVPQLSTPRLRTLLSKLGRVLLALGSPPEYVFSHSGLGDHYADDLMTLRERDSVDRAFARHVTHADPPSRYALAHASAHLTQAQAPTLDFMALLSRRRREAWREIEGGHGGFLRDVSVAREHAEASRSLPRMVRCAMIVASERAVSAPPEWLVAAALGEQLWSPEHVFAQVRMCASDNDLRGAAVLLGLLGARLPASTRQEALDIAVDIAREGNTEPLRDVASVWGPSIAGPLLAACARLNDLQRVRALASLLPVVAGADRAEVEAALQATLAAITHPNARFAAFRDVGIASDEPLRSQLLEDAWSMAVALKDPRACASVIATAADGVDPRSAALESKRFAIAAGRLARTDEAHGAPMLLDAAAQLAESEPLVAVCGELAQTSAGRKAIADWLFHFGSIVGPPKMRREERLSLVHECAPDVFRSALDHHLERAAVAGSADVVHAYGLCRPYCSPSQREAFVRIIRGAPQRMLAWALPEIVADLPEVERVGAFIGAFEIEDLQSMLRALQLVWRDLPETGRAEARRALVETPRRAAHALGLLVADAPDDAFTVALEIEDVVERVLVLGWTTRFSTDRDLAAHALERALADARGLSPASTRFNTACSLATASGSDAPWTMVLENDDTVLYLARGSALFVGLMSDEQRATYLSRAWALARAMPAHSDRGSYLQHLVTQLPAGPDRAAAVRLALEGAESLLDHGYVVKALIDHLRDASALQHLFGLIKPLLPEDRIKSQAASGLFNASSSADFRDELVTYMTKDTAGTREPVALGACVLWSSRADAPQLRRALDEAERAAVELEARPDSPHDASRRYARTTDEEAVTELRFMQAAFGDAHDAERVIDRLPRHLRSGVMARLDPAARAPRLAAELEWARRQSDTERGVHIASLVEHAGEAERATLVDEVLQHAGRHPVRALIPLAPHLGQEHLGALELRLDGMAKEPGTEWEHVRLWVAKLPDGLRAAVVDLIFDRAKVWPVLAQRRARGRLVDHCSAEHRETAFDDALILRDAHAAESLGCAAPQLTRRQLERARDAVTTWWREAPRHSAMPGPLAEIHRALVGWGGEAALAAAWSFVAEVLRVESLSRPRVVSALGILSPLIDHIAEGQRELAAKAALEVAEWWW